MVFLDLQAVSKYERGNTVLQPLHFSMHEGEKVQLQVKQGRENLLF